MPILESNGLKLLIKHHTTYEIKKYYWIEIAYQIGFFWQDLPILNEEVTESTDGIIYAEDDSESGILKLFKKALVSGEIEFWDFYEPRITIVVYPEKDFPFYKSKNNNNDEKNTNVKSKSAEDLFYIVVEVDSFNFKDAIYYTKNGMAFNITVKRRQLEIFIQELEKDLIDLLKKDNINYIDQFLKLDYK